MNVLRFLIPRNCLWASDIVNEEQGTIARRRRGGVRWTDGRCSDVVNGRREYKCVCRIVAWICIDDKRLEIRTVRDQPFRTHLSKTPQKHKQFYPYSSLVQINKIFIFILFIYIVQRFTMKIVFEMIFYLWNFWNGRVNNDVWTIKRFIQIDFGFYFL